jgi:tetratricopeptide (TPR) repeat protein
MLQRTLALGNDWYAPRFQLAVCLRELGRSAEAREQYERAIAANPGLLAAYDDLIALLEDAGLRDAAEEWRQRRSAAAPGAASGG